MKQSVAPTKKIHAPKKATQVRKNKFMLGIPVSACGWFVMSSRATYPLNSLSGARYPHVNVRSQVPWVSSAAVCYIG